MSARTTPARRRLLDNGGFRRIPYRSHPPPWPCHEAEPNALLVLERVDHHLDGLLAMHRWNNKSLLERAKRSQSVNRFGLLWRGIGLAQHPLGKTHLDVTYRHRSPVPTNRLLLA